MRLILPIWILLLHMTCAWGLLIPQETRMGAEGWAAYSPSSTSTSTQASRSATRTVTYSYDDLHRLTSEVLGGSEETGTVAYTLDDVGNRLGRTSSVAGITPQSLSYSANDWLNSHQYDANGNTLRSDLTSGSVARDAYDFKNRLSQRRIYDASGTVLQKIIDLRYDGDGSLKWKRVTDTTTGEETIRFFVVDHHNLTGYSQIVEELDATGAVVTTYHYGHDLISQSMLVEDEATGLSEWVDRIFLYDGGGHVRALTDLEGNITDTFSYDAYGNLLGYGLSAIGSLPTAYLYRGERYDPDLGQYYLRARFYDADLGRFHTLDEYEGRTGEPLSLHKYLYAHANPVTGWDPSGRFTLPSFSAVKFVIGNLVRQGIGSMVRLGVNTFIIRARAFVRSCLTAAPILLADLGLSSALSRGGHKLAGNAQLYQVVVKDNRILDFFKKSLGYDPVIDLKAGRNPKGFSWHHSLFKKNRLILLNNQCHKAYHSLFGAKGGWDIFWKIV